MKKKVVVSGASRGLGLAIAAELAPEWDVVTFARSKADKEIPGVRHLADIDVRDNKQLELLEPELGDADALVNNVGVAFDGILATQSLESIEDTIATNLVSVLYLTKLYVRARMAKRQSGNVVSVGSIISTRGFSGLAAYSASKGGIDAMTRSLARELGPKGFRFNNVLPGYFDSDMSAGLDDQKRQQIIRRTPLGRLSEIDDVTPVVSFLLSDDARFITGQSLVVDGGVTV